jgi:hypothetical protein
MKNFEEKEVKDLSVILGGIGEPVPTYKITAHVGKDDWNCFEVKVDFDIVYKK